MTPLVFVFEPWMQRSLLAVIGCGVVFLVMLGFSARPPKPTQLEQDRKGESDR
jgi:hypothetical protein